MSRIADAGSGAGSAGGSVARVEADARRLGLDVTPVMLAEGTRTAEDAARACGCEIDQIVKSIIFRDSGVREPGGARYFLFLTAGGNRVDGGKAAGLAGAALEKADAAGVRQHTGFAIGGVAPLGHLNPVETWMDPRLLDFGTVWAAAGSPNHVFEVSPARLAAAVGAVVADFSA